MFISLTNSELVEPLKTHLALGENAGIEQADSLGGRRSRMHMPAVRHKLDRNDCVHNSSTGREPLAILFTFITQGVGERRVEMAIGSTGVLSLYHDVRLL